MGVGRNNKVFGAPLSRTMQEVIHVRVSYCCMCSTFVVHPLRFSSLASRDTPTARARAQQRVLRQVHFGLARNIGSSASSVGAAPMPALDGKGGAAGAGDLVRIGTVVKDRRTVQDIEEESRKRRRGC